MDIATYEAGDLDAVRRIWRECGWVDSDEEAALLEPFLADARARVVRIDGDAESCATVHDGLLRYVDVDLPLAAVSSVTSSHIGRKQGLARAVTAAVLADAAGDGAAVAVLGMFEQGFYDRLGFGTGTYEITHRFDPASLRVGPWRRPPVRLTLADVDDLNAAMLRRVRPHGSIRIDSATRLRAELGWNDPSFGLGYRDDDGRVTHFVWGKAKAESGPYVVGHLAYRTTDELMELLAVLRSLGDQVRTVRMVEPAEVQLQDLIDHPGRQTILTRGADAPAGAIADAWWQARILDLPTCVAARRWEGEPLRLAVEVHDPVADVDGWPAVSGTYRVELGASSSAERVTAPDDDLPLLRTSVNAFTRLWLGVRPASSLAVTDDLAGSAELLRALDEVFRLPPPHPTMDI